MENIFMYDEKFLGERILRLGFSNNSYSYREALLVSKYFRNVYAWGDSKVKKGVIEFCEKSDPFFHYNANREKIKNVVKNGKYPLKDYTDTIFIYKDEIEDIQKIKNYKIQKIAITILAIIKRNFKYGKEYLNRRDWATIKKIIGNNRTTNKEIEDCLHRLKTFELVTPSGNYASNKILFLKHEGEVAITIDTDAMFRSTGKLYEDYCGGELGYCLTCGESFIKKGHHDKFCSIHKEKREKQRKALWKREKYNAYK